MPSTPNYSWTMPTVGGSTGVWGTVLNTNCFTEIDDDLFKTEGMVIGQPSVLAVAGGGNAWVVGYGYGVASLSRNQTTNPITDVANIPLDFLQAGMRVTAFRSVGVAQSGAACTVGLAYLTNTTGAETIVSAGHSLPATSALTETSGLTHDVATGRVYYAKVSPSGSAGSITVVLISVTTIRTP